jgi:hypothetical protein
MYKTLIVYSQIYVRGDRCNRISYLEECATEGRMGID